MSTREMRVVNSRGGGGSRRRLRQLLALFVVCICSGVVRSLVYLIPKVGSGCLNGGHILPSASCRRGHCISVMTEGMKVCGAATTTALLGRTSCRVFGSMFSKRTRTSMITLMARRRKRPSPVLDFNALEEEFTLGGEGLGGPVVASIGKSSRDKEKIKNCEKSEVRNARPISAKKRKANFEGLGEEADAIVLPTFNSKAKSGQESEHYKTVARTIGAQKVLEQQAKEIKKIEEVHLKSPQSVTEDENYPEYISETMKNKDDAKSRVTKGSEGGEDEEKAETLETKLRKTRPPASVRILNSIPQPDFVSIRLENVAVTFKNQEVLLDATWEVKSGDRLGLVGANGEGKTTQARILAGDIEPTTGEIVKSGKNLRTALLRQEFINELSMGRTLRDELHSACIEEMQIFEVLSKLERKLEDKDVQDNIDMMQDVLDELSVVQDRAEKLEVYSLDVKVDKVMSQMGFAPDDSELTVDTFSGGWRMRIGIGKVLLQNPNILLLDEPTNHMDLESVEWLEDFLRSLSVPMVIISHDREFLDRVCNKIVDTVGGSTLSYDGNYSQFMKLKTSRLDTWQKSYEAQQKRIKDERAWMNQYRNKAGFVSQVNNREKILERLTNGPDAIKKPPRTLKPFAFRFPPAPRASMALVSVNSVIHNYPNDPLFDDISLTVEQGDRLAVVGSNGSGKSTLLRLIVGSEEPQIGTASLGPGIIVNHFQQDQADALDMDKTVMETIEEAATNGESYNDLRKLLAQFSFRGDSVKKVISQLSGGEKARIVLCMFMLRPANLLVLDEPTNHLDIMAKEMLEEALQHFPGGVIVVSHDRYFVSQVAKSICAIENRKLVRYEGDYKYYMEQTTWLKEKVERRYVGDGDGICSAKVVNLDDVELEGKKSKSFGGRGGPSGRLFKGVKNAKRQKIMV